MHYRIHSISTSKKSYFKLSVLSLLCSQAFISLPSMAAVTSPYLDTFEAVAQNASIPGSSYVYNSWGQHQTRITRHTDGSVRMVYLSTDAQKNVIWQVMRRKATGGWSKESSNISTDDVMLLRDAKSDQAHVVAWPSGIASVYTSPTFVPAKIPGSWGVLPPTARHYAASGISADGTLCLKASKEIYTTSSTIRTSAEYTCGTHTSGNWTWSPFVSRYIGPRFTYDYVFPSPDGVATKGLYATATSDLYKDVTEVPNLDPAYGNYVFNGLRLYLTGLDSDASWLNVDTKLDASLAVSYATATGKKVAAPVMRIQDSLIDSKGRAFTSYFADDPTNSTVRGLYLSVSDKAGAVLFASKWKLPTYGYTRLYEDSKQRLWLLWSAAGAQTSYVYLYPVNETLVNGQPAFTLGAFKDLSASFYPYFLYDNLFIASPRSGTAKSLYIDLLYNACAATYQKGVNFNVGLCYNLSDSLSRQRVFYARIRLPD